MVEVIYCAGGNKRFASIAIDAGFTYGAQLPNTVYHAPEFVDQNWRSPDLERYAEAVALHKPRLATVLDWERWGQLDEVIKWAEAIVPYVSEAIIIIPKVIGGIYHLPRQIGDIPVRLGYSVPTSFGQTSVSLTEFLGWPIHLLGGSPIIQAKLAGLHLNGNFLVEAPKLNVVSIDGNYHQFMATKFNQFFAPDGSARYAKNRFWPTLKEADGQKWGDGSKAAGAPYEAFSRSCKAIMEMWQRRIS